MTNLPPLRKAASNTAAAAVVVVVIIVAGFAAYWYLGTYGAPTTTAFTSSSVSQSSGPLVAYSADAYASETAALLGSFSQATGTAVAPVKAGGSFADANAIAAGAPADLFVSVSLEATGTRYLGNLSSGWAVGFASDQMVIAYSNGSAAAAVAEKGRAAEASNATSDWSGFFGALTSGSVKVGISSPVSDPAGLRGWLVLEAAGALYAQGDQSAFTAPLLENGANVTGASAAALVAPLQSGQLQFLLIYKSAAVADHLGYISLDRHVNLSDPELSAYYRQFTYTDSAGTTAGSPILLCITVPLSAANPADALRFVQYVVESSSSLSSYGLTVLAPAQLYSNVAPPAAIAQLVSEGFIVQAGGLG